MYIYNYICICMQGPCPAAIQAVLDEAGDIDIYNVYSDVCLSALAALNNASNPSAALGAGLLKSLAGSNPSCCTCSDLIVFFTGFSVVTGCIVIYRHSCIITTI